MSKKVSDEAENPALNKGGKEASIGKKEEPKQIYYNTVGRENGVHVLKGQFNTQKEALDLANELNRKFPDLYYDWRETLIKEEPKQIKCYCGHTTMCDCSPLEELKQETLEDAAENYVNSKNPQWTPYHRQSFKDGAEWQAERMYSKEEVLQLLLRLQQTESKDDNLDYLEFIKERVIEQFKKK